MSEISYAAPAEIDHYRQRALVIGVVALVLCAASAAIIKDRIFFSYLVGFVFWTGVALGSLAIAMLHQLSGGNWGVVIRRLLESATKTFPLLAILFLPVVAGLLFGDLYEWAHIEKVTGKEREILEHKKFYLNTLFFLGRAAFYFIVWISLTYLFNKWSREQDETGDRRLQRKLQILSGPGIVLYGLTVTFSSIDWVMSLDPEWFSTIFGVLFMGGQGLSALALIIALLVLLSKHEPLASKVKPAHLHDLGKLMLAFVMLWAYFNFSQFLIIWAGNLPEEIPWYIRRLQGSWKWVGLMLVVFHFALPFFLLLSRDLKRNARRLITVALLVVFMRFIDVIWLIAPEFQEKDFTARKLGIVMDFVALIGVGGIWMWFFLSRLKERPILPLHDPNWEDAES
ncbi:MAG: hypothetical protein L0229_16915 [Blastocatellia bacterium]|nr:hypothetical protein [Blastocatellia bacterium]